ncbi:MAG: pyridoxamine 5'-phosphate oxidase family protein [Geminicoccaceae bacterium]|nr:pyridoxamine 5'-phosphate oxidase family protein [Geminicoccaceae bacterium]
MPSLESTRIPERMSTSRAELDALLDSQYLAHVGLSVDGEPVVFPTLFARDGDRLLIHGSTGSRWLRGLAAGASACVTVTEVGGIVVARSAFESSIVYRSAMIFGTFTVASDQVAALGILTDNVLPGRTGEVRPSTGKELAATMALELPIEAWSLRASDHWPEDPPEDVAGAAWAGIVRYGPRPALAHAAPDLAAGIAVPPSVQSLTDPA